MSSGYPSGLTASAIEAVIRFYWSPQAHNLYSYSDTEAQLFAAGLIEEKDGEVKLTHCGLVFARHLLETPLPTQTWQVVRIPVNGNG